MPSPTQAAARPGPSFTAVSSAEQPSAWVTGLEWGGGTALMGLALAFAWVTVRPTPRRRPPEVPAPVWLRGRPRASGLTFGFTEDTLSAVKTRPPAACPVFASASQARLLALLLHHPERWWTTPELRDTLGVSAATLHDELVRLTDAALLDRDDGSRPHRYRANAASPLAGPLRALIELTVAVPLRIQEAISDEPGIEAAGIFGSWARGDARAGSDIDLMVVGQVDLRRLVRRVRPIEREIRREINVVSYDRAELAKRLSSGFLRGVRRGPVNNLIGDLHEALGA